MRNAQLNSPSQSAPANLQRRLGLERGLKLGIAVCGSVQILPALAQGSAATVLRQSQALMGTWVEFQVQHQNQGLMAAALQAAWSRMSELAQRLSRYDAASELQQLIQTGAERDFKASPMLFEVLMQAQARHKSTAGRFDIRVGQLTAWDFRPGQYHLAQAAEIKQQLRLMQQSSFSLYPESRRVRLNRPQLKLDLGGIAKLAILNSGFQILRDAGIQNVLLNGGGDIFVAGLNQGKPWRLAIRDPRQPARFLQVLELEQGVLASSGDYERCFDVAGRHYHHILDPQTAYPSQAHKGVSLLAQDYRALNGLGSSLMIADQAQAATLISRHHGVAAILTQADARVSQQGNWPQAFTI